MGVEYTVTCVWLPRQPFYRPPKDGRAIDGIAWQRWAAQPESATLSEAVRAAIAEYNAGRESAAGQDGVEGALDMGAAASPAGGNEAAVAPNLSRTGPGTQPVPVGKIATVPGTPLPGGNGSQDAEDAAEVEAAREVLDAEAWPGPVPLVRSLASLLVVMPREAADGDSSPRYPLQEEYMWLERCQLPSGALVMAPGDRRINPYFANQAAVVLLGWNPGAVRSYIVWYLDHLNELDRYGLEGTVYDYHLYGDEERSERDYDSADGYAATFLTLVARYVFATGDAALVVSRFDQLQSVAGVCLALQDQDGLTWAKADHRYKFLMDNCEVARGLADGAEVLRTIGFWKQGDAWAQAADRVRLAVEGELWSEQRGEYAWAKTSRGPQWVRRRWYPDTVGQLYPIVFGLIDPSGDRARQLVQRVNTAFPGWVRFSTGDNYPWALTAYAHALAGERERALEFVDHVWEHFLSDGRPWPWYNLEAAHFILTLLELAEAGASGPIRR